MAGQTAGPSGGTFLSANEQLTPGRGLVGTPAVAVGPAPTTAADARLTATSLELSPLYRGIGGERGAGPSPATGRRNGGENR